MYIKLFFKDKDILSFDDIGYTHVTSECGFPCLCCVRFDDSFFYVEMEKLSHMTVKDGIKTHAWTYEDIYLQEEV